MFCLLACILAIGEATRRFSPAVAQAPQPVIQARPSRYAIGFYGLLRTYVIPAVQRNINATLLAPNDADGGIDIYWHIYADEGQKDQRQALDRIRADPRTVGLVVEPWTLSGGEASSWHRRRLAKTSRVGPGSSSLRKNDNPWTTLPLPKWLLGELENDHPVVADGKSYSGSVGTHEAGTLSHWRKKKLVSDMIQEGARQLKRRQENNRTATDAYTVVALARSDIVYPVAKGQPLPILFRHFETPKDEDIVIVPEKGDYNGGLQDMFVAGSCNSISKYAQLYAALPGMAANQSLPTTRGSRISHSKSFHRVINFDSEALLLTHLRRSRVRIARTPLVMTAVRTGTFMQHTGPKYSPTALADLLSNQGFPAACSPDVWSKVAGPKAECPICCTNAEASSAWNAATAAAEGENLRRADSDVNASTRQHSLGVCWGAGFFNSFSYTGVESKGSDICKCSRKLDCDLCAPIGAVTRYRCSPLRGMYCVHSHFNHKRHPAKDDCPAPGALQHMLPSS